METVQPIVFVVFVVLYTLTAAVWDQLYWKIPNKLTLPMFFAGWLYQLVFNGLAGLGDGALGFLIGFGFLFLMWIIGSGGGGDVKLMGALSVWLGFRWAMYVFVVSTFLIILLAIGVLLWNVLSVGIKTTKKKMLATGKPSRLGQTQTESVEQKQQRRIMAYALPVLISTWGLLIMGFVMDQPTLPWNM